MACANPEFRGTRRQDVPWENFTRSVRYVIPDYFEPNDVGDLAWIVQHAEEEGKKVKAVGSGWSIEEIAVSEDWVVDLGRLSNRLTTLVDTATTSSSIVESKRTAHLDTASANKLIHVEAGIKIIDLNVLLQDLGLAMPTLGGAQGQRLAGAMATSTHGSDIDFSSISDLALAIHLVTEGGQELWIEQESDPLTTDDEMLRADAALCADTIIVRNDALFNAVKVGVGRFGIIYSYVLSVTTSFRLVEWTQSITWDDVSTSLAIDRTGREIFDDLNALLGEPLESLQAIGDFRYLDITFNPRRRRDCWVRRRWLTGAAEDLNIEDSSNPLCHPGVGNLVLAAASAALSSYAALVSSIPFYGWVKGPLVFARATHLSLLSGDPHMTGGAALAEAVNAVWESQMHDDLKWLIEELNQIVLNETFGKSIAEGKRGASWNVTSGTRESGFDRNCFNGTSTEIIFPISDRAFIDFINFLLHEASNFLTVGYISVRFTSSSMGLLSMHRVDATHAVSIEVTSLHGLTDTHRWLQFIERRGVEMGGRPHWGQFNRLNNVDVARLYGESLTQWRTQLASICNRDTFSNRYTQQRGLEPGKKIRTVTAVMKTNGVITHLCNPGEAWSPVPIETAMAEIVTLRVAYYVARSDGNRVELIERSYLATRGDDRRDNNIRNLPLSRSPRLTRPFVGLTRRCVTSILLSEGRATHPWDTWVNYVCNDAEGWKVHATEAFEHIRAGTVEYVVETSDGTQTPIFIKRYLISYPNEFEEDNLDNLPEIP